jgi:channel protein (hemolysin III family)
LIAGSYTPIIFIKLSQFPIAINILIMQWLFAFIGMVIHLYTNPKNKMVVIVETSMYLIMGWMAVLLWEPLN